LPRLQQFERQHRRALRNIEKRESGVDFRDLVKEPPPIEEQ
jgi:hypothetical protein